jgi:hypothetical protein
MDAQERAVRDRAIMQDIRAGKDRRKIAAKFHLTYARILQIGEREIRRRKRRNRK